MLYLFIFIPIPPNVKLHGHAQGVCKRSVKQALIFVGCCWASFRQLCNEVSGVET